MLRPRLIKERSIFLFNINAINLNPIFQAALETYLQTLIDLPVKDKNEIIAFFCSDVVRETKKPVYQAGYKEGYLTKRGKNFGGWKTRYFVLQGPVLEYYESVSSEIRMF